MLDILTWILPTTILAALLLIAVLAHLFITKLIFRKENPSPEKEVEPYQVALFGPYLNAGRLQLETNIWHNRAIKSKTMYERVGVAACAVAPALIVLSALEPIMEHLLHSTEEQIRRGVYLADLIGAALVLGIFWIFRKPSKPHIENRMRSECLRSHLHCLLARVGRFSHDESYADTIIEEVKGMSAEEALSHLHHLQMLCSNQTQNPNALPLAPSFTPNCAFAYFKERVGEQVGDKNFKGYFPKAGKRKTWAYSFSAWFAILVVFIATIVGAIRVFGLATEISSLLFSICGGLAVLVIGLRSVFGWDSKANLYHRQYQRLEDLATTLSEKKLRLEQGDQAAAVPFCLAAAAFESLMAQEACDWMLISDREYYDVTP